MGKDPSVVGESSFRLDQEAGVRGWTAFDRMVLIGVPQPPGARLPVYGSHYIAFDSPAARAAFLRELVHFAAHRADYDNGTYRALEVSLEDQAHLASKAGV